MKRAIKIILIILGVVLLIIAGYVIWVFASYYRIEDFEVLKIEGENNLPKIKNNEEYTVVTQNMGFGAYSADFTFFMDGGKESRARSRDEVLKNFELGCKTVKEVDPDFILFQEIDIDGTRSHHVDEEKLVESAFAEYNHNMAINCHSPYLCYPITEPHGAFTGGIMFFARYEMDSAIRRRLDISESFSKILDLDRCYSITRLPVEGGKELVVFNIHASAYGGDASIRTSQQTQLLKNMKQEYDAGNYAICGGDFNHDFTGDSLVTMNDNLSEVYGWAQPYPDELIPENIVKCVNYSNGLNLPSARNCDIPYGEDNCVLILDGFMVSSNVDVTYLENIQTGFEYSDHSPVVMKFKLK